MSLMKVWNSGGLKVDPCGEPDVVIIAIIII
jgi:hypothetical protein